MEKLNERLITKVLAHIKAFPEAYDQNDVADSCSVTKGTPCGAIGCFGGWAVLLGFRKSERHDVAQGVDLSDARDLLGLEENEANHLFATASGNPKKDYKTIVKRLAEIRAARKLYHDITKNQSVTGLTLEFPTVDGEALVYEF